MSGCICHYSFIEGCPHCHQRAGLPLPTKAETDASIARAQQAAEPSRSVYDKKLGWLYDSSGQWGWKVTDAQEFKSEREGWETVNAMIENGMTEIMPLNVAVPRVR